MAATGSMCMLWRWDAMPDGSGGNCDGDDRYMSENHGFVSIFVSAATASARLTVPAA